MFGSTPLLKLPLHSTNSTPLQSVWVFCSSTPPPLVGLLQHLGLSTSSRGPAPPYSFFFGSLLGWAMRSRHFFFLVAYAVLWTSTWPLLHSFFCFFVFLLCCVAIICTHLHGCICLFVYKVHHDEKRKIINNQIE